MMQNAGELVPWGPSLEPLDGETIQMSTSSHRDPPAAAAAAASHTQFSSFFPHHLEQNQMGTHDTMSGPPRIILYAELLSNIRQVSVGCSLSSACTTMSTQASLSADGQQLTVQHEDEERTLRLPGRVSAPQKLPIQSRDSRNLAWRLPLAGAAPATRFIPPSQLDAQTVAWSATDLPAGGMVKCRDCQTTVIEEGAINTWKDLPSENWAEMMEVWHCHKPDNVDHQGHEHPHHDGQTETEQHLAGRGYGANSRIAGQAGTGFVDLSSLLFFEKDCTNLTVS